MPDLIRFIRRTEEGSTEPPVFLADDRHYYVVKGGRGVLPDHVAEYLAYKLAPALAVPTPPASTLGVPPALIEATRAAGPEFRNVATLLESKDGLVFGSQYLPGARVIDPFLDLRAEERKRQALLLLAFDLWIGNKDRRRINPNALYVAHGLVAIDHAQAFPWLVGETADVHAIVQEHLALEVLERSEAPALAAVAAAVEAIPPSPIRAALAAVPAGWWPREVQMAELFATLEDQRDAVARFFLQAASR